ncbi:SRPBCC family protein [Planosporangium sp. 12N6]|uniref:SRPBCC family protein n=1 Tax=Planosporangium spinosum TaxID=3402278 RepID=UPI003CEBC47C
MAPIVFTIEIALPPTGVFAYVTDVLRFPEWQKDVVGVRMVDGQPPRVGARFTTTRRIGRAERTMTQQITEIDPSRRWAARGVDGPVRPHAAVTVEPCGDGTRSRITLALDYEGHGIGVPLLPLVRRQTRAGAPISLGNLKKRLEGAGSDGEPGAPSDRS